MSSHLEFTKGLSTSNSRAVGGTDATGDIIAKAKCAFCNHRVALRQVAPSSKSRTNGERMVPAGCDNCDSLMIINIEHKQIHPAPSVSRLEDLPSGIDNYYQEALRCIEANAPNGAATVFRKVIHAVCIHYDVADVDDKTSLYSMIEKLANEGVITETLRKSLLGVKDAGNDGAHINDRDPTLEQAKNMKDIVEAVLTQTVVADQRVEELRDEHPNPHQE